MPELEKQIEKRFLKSMKRLGIPTIKLTGQYGTGWPDRLILIPGGRPVFIEFKAEGKEPTDRQHHRIDQLKTLGYDATWFDNAEEALAYVERNLEAS